MQIEQKLAALGLVLPAPVVPLVNRAPTARAGSLLFVSGHLPRMPDGSLLNTGKVGHQVIVEQGYAAAQQATLDCLASIKAAIGDLDKVTQVVKLLVMVNADPQFDRQFIVANGASDLLIGLYGEAGRHARSAVGMGSLPSGMPIEIEMIVEVED